MCMRSPCPSHTFQITDDINFDDNYPFQLQVKILKIQYFSREGNFQTSNS